MNTWTVNITLKLVAMQGGLYDCHWIDWKCKQPRNWSLHIDWTLQKEDDNENYSPSLSLPFKRSGGEK